MVDQGQSTKASKQYTIELQVEVLHSLILHLNLKKVHVVGISYGASVALQFSKKYQNFINKMVISNVVAYTSPWLKAIGEGWNQVGRSRDGEAYYNITIPYIYSPQFYKERIEWMEARKKVLIPVFSDPNFLDAMERLTISSFVHDVRLDLRNIEVDTLVISSREDYLTPVFEQKAIVDLMPNASWVLIEECGHASMYEKPNQFVSLTIGHLLNQTKIVI
jgi:pimeloyl-ACP methyl ester carboxylesterase